jgi:hypothetical protein
MHRLSLTMAMLSLLTLGAAEAPIIRIVPRDAVPSREFICPCEFDLGNDIDGETGLIIDHNGEDQAAFANIEGTVVRLENKERFRFDCETGDSVIASWTGKDLDVRVNLTIEGQGEESCWFRGHLTVKKGNRTEKRSIVGACGC